MYLMIDNYDSFVYNLRAYFEEIGRKILVRRCDTLSLDEIESLHPEGIILSPGPKRPQDALLCVEVVKRFQGRIPILGVCLGHQVIGYCTGASVQKGRTPMHGKITAIHHNGSGCFAGLPNPFSVTRYHSLTIQPDSLPDSYRIDAVSEDGAVMAISHRSLPVYGVQFHPEAVLTEYGHELLENFCRIAEQFSQTASKAKPSFSRNAAMDFPASGTSDMKKSAASSARCIKELPYSLSAAQAFRRLSGTVKCAFLDSSLVNSLGRYSIIGMQPYLKLVKSREGFFVNDRPETELSFEAYLRGYLSEHIDPNETELPLVSGAIGYFSYDYGRKLQDIPSHQTPYATIPDVVLIFYDAFLIDDLQNKKTFLIANGNTEPAKDCLERILTLLEDIPSRDSDNAASLAGQPLEDPGNASSLSGQLSEDPSNASSLSGQLLKTPDAASAFPMTVTLNFEKDAYKQAIQRMIQYIVEGDIYIANMTQRLSIACEKSPLDLFFALRSSNPSPFGAYLDYGDFQIVCASPERFLQMKNGHVQTRPIKGTRKRGDTPEEDLRMRRELENSEKDKSELLMIVDLERNDLNRVCRSGSVKVSELFTVEEYATVFHLVSNIEGNLLPDKTVVDLLEATFPGGSITGAPKYRAMEIIDELEHGQRGLYTGSIGYLTLDNCCDFNIVIRTALHQNGVYHLGVGGGITAESELEFEYEETLQKAKALLDAMKRPL